MLAMERLWIFLSIIRKMNNTHTLPGSLGLTLPETRPLFMADTAIECKAAQQPISGNFSYYTHTSLPPPS